MKFIRSSIHKKYSVLIILTSDKSNKIVGHLGNKKKYIYWRYNENKSKVLHKKF